MFDRQIKQKRKAKRRSENVRHVDVQIHLKIHQPATDSASKQLPTSQLIILFISFLKPKIVQITLSSKNGFFLLFLNNSIFSRLRNVNDKRGKINIPLSHSVHRASGSSGQRPSMLWFLSEVWKNSQGDLVEKTTCTYG